MPTIYDAYTRVYPLGFPPQSQGSDVVLRYRVTTKSALRTTAEHALRRKNPHIWMPPTPFSATEDNVVRYVVKFGSSAYPKGGSIDRTPTMPSYPTADELHLTNRTLIDCRLQMKNMKVNLAQAFAERRQASNLVAQSARRMAAAIWQLRRGNIRGAAEKLGYLAPKGLRSQVQKGGLYGPKGLLRPGASVAKATQALSNDWLALQYGWKPLVSDIYGSMVALHENDKDVPDRYRVTVRSTKTQKYKTSYDTATSGIYEDVFYVGMLGCRIRLDYVLLYPGLAAGFSIGDHPLTLAWELLPFSFVADWFIPIGDYLGGLGADIPFTFLGGSKTIKWEFDSSGGKFKRYDWSSTAMRYPPQYWWGVGGARQYKSINRTVYTSSPAPRFPGFKNPMSLTHVANAIALLRGSVTVR